MINKRAAKRKNDFDTNPADPTFRGTEPSNKSDKKRKGMCVWTNHGSVPINIYITRGHEMSDINTSEILPYFLGVRIQVGYNSGSHCPITRLGRSYMSLRMEKQKVAGIGAPHGLRRTQCE